MRQGVRRRLRWPLAVTLTLAAVGGCAGGPRDLASAAPVPSICGTGTNAAVCFASVDPSGKLNDAGRARLAAAAPLAIDIVSSPDFAAELAGFEARMPASWRSLDRYWGKVDGAGTPARLRAAFSGLDIDTKGGLRARLAASFMHNLAYEGEQQADGRRSIQLNRYRLDRTSAELVETYVHEAAHKTGLGHAPRQTPDQKCQPPYVLGQIARKLADPGGWPAFASSADACRFWRDAPAR